MKRSLVILGLLVLFVLLLPGAAAIAQYPPTVGDLIIDKTVVEPGGSVRVSGDGFCPGASITVSLVPTTGAPRTLGAFTADATGNFAGNVTIPADVAPGTYTLQASGLSRTESTDCVVTRVLSANLTVRAAAAAAPAAPAPSGILGVTGVEALTWLIAGLGVIGVGVGAVIVSRRRSRVGQG